MQDQAFDGDWEVIVADNQSTDDTARIVTERAEAWPRLRLVSADDIGDKSHAINTAVAASAADAFLFTDGDDIVMPGWVQAGADALATHDLITGPLDLVALNEPWLADSRGMSSDNLTGNFEGLFPCIRGNNYGITRSAWEALGPLPLGVYPVDDVTLSLEARRIGIDVVGVPDLMVEYRYRTDVGSLWKQGHGYGRGRSRIVRNLVDHGEERPGRFAGAKSWAWLVVNLPGVVTGPGRARWVWVLANRLGQVRGSVENRVFYL